MGDDELGCYSDSSTHHRPFFWSEIFQSDARNMETSCQDTAWLAAPFIQEMYSRMTSFSVPLLPFLIVVVVVLVLLVAPCWIKRRRTYRSLVRCGFPTVFWRPKFVNYNDELERDEKDANHRLATTSGHATTTPLVKKKLASSTITNIIPRMQRLNGPYGMYGTVYGVSTAVVHVAHPVPAMALLGASSQQVLKQNKPDAAPGKRLSWFSSLQPPNKIDHGSTLGATKAPAYNHFKNFCGEGVFTADGDDWRSKRAAVLHALLRCAKTTTSFQERIETEANRAADRLCHFVDHNIQANNGESPVYKTNIVPVLQRATIGLIYRYITHTDLPTVTDDVDDETSTDCSSATETEMTIDMAS